MGLLTNFVSNNAAAAVGTPLAVEVARALVLPEPFVPAVPGCNSALRHADGLHRPTCW
ncbi:MAG: hypothetical protein H6931_09880 [Burkholderiaceae bacterium]|nr:hypothetical protein [Burkholderiaceae bacterium]